MAPELDDEEAQARADVWKHIFGFIKSSVLVCAVELDIPDILQNHGGPISLSDLSAAVGCPSEPLHRVMRFLTHYNIFKKVPPPSDDHNNSSPPPVYYAQTALSRLLTGDNLAAFMLLQGSPLSRGPIGVTAQALRTGENRFLKSVQGEDSWTDPAFGFHMKVFTDAMAAHTKVTTAAVVENFPEMFEGIGSVVDVGGRHGRSLSLLVKAFPWVRGTCFDLPEIVAKAPPCDGVEFVGGSMFESVPKADAVMLMWILHDWSDEACIEILKKCKEAIPKDTGKVVIVDAIIDEDDEYTEARLLLDMFMMAVTVKGKERTYGEWAHLLNEADFSSFTVKSIKTMEFVIQAYP